MKELYIRADMNAEIATGHVMRCLSIADAAAKMGIKCIFIAADENPKSVVEGRGHGFICLHTDWHNKESELPALKEIIIKNEVKHLIVDSYEVTTAYLRALNEITDVSYIDDVDAMEYPVNKIICYSRYADEFKDSVNYRGSELILGNEYTPIRDLYIGMPPKEISKKIGRVLLLSGGSDSCHAIKKILSVFEDLKDIDVQAICGRFNPDRDELMDKYKNSENIYLCDQLENLKEAMVKADVAISAGGSTLNELCAVGTPTITYSFADNQVPGVSRLHKDGIMDCAGDLRYDDVPSKVLKLLKKYNDPAFRKERSLIMQELIDGRGAERIVRRIFK